MFGFAVQEELFSLCRNEKERDDRRVGLMRILQPGLVQSYEYARNMLMALLLHGSAYRKLTTEDMYDK